VAGILADKKVLVKDEAEGSQIYNKGYFGNPLSGGGLELDLLDAIYLLEAERLEIRSNNNPVSHAMLMSEGVKAINEFEIQYLVFRDMRMRGYVVRRGPEPGDFHVFPRGGAPKKTPSKWWLLAISERRIFDYGEFSKILDQVEKSKKHLLVALVDEEGDITYYECVRKPPRGNLHSNPLKSQIKGILLNDRVLVEGHAWVNLLQKSEFFGKKVWEALQLSLCEALYLVERGDMNIVNAKTKRAINADTLKRKAVEVQKDFHLRYRVYCDLKKNNMLVKTGFKYGSHFRAYKGDPDVYHAKYLVHAVEKDFRTSWPELSRIIRLAHGVKKEIAFARVLERSVEYLRLKRVRP